MLTNVHRPNEPSFIEMSTFTCKSSRSHFGRNGTPSRYRVRERRYTDHSNHFQDVRPYGLADEPQTITEDPEIS